MNDTEIVDYLIELIAAHEGGTHVILGYDDATFEYSVAIGRDHKTLGMSRSFRRAVQLAKSGEKYE